MYIILKGVSLAKNKEFKGHVVSGYACQIAFSPNGRFLACVMMVDSYGFGIGFAAVD